MSVEYKTEFKKKFISPFRRRSNKESLSDEYHLGQGTLAYWLQQRRKECQTSPKIKEEFDSYTEVNRLRKELAEVEKENLFVKKQWHALRRKSIRIVQVSSALQR